MKSEFSEKWCEQTTECPKENSTETDEQKRTTPFEDLLTEKLTHFKIFSIIHWQLCVQVNSHDADIVIFTDLND